MADVSAMRLLNRVGRVIGALSGAAATVAWATAIWVRSVGLSLSNVSFVVALLLLALALFAAIASVRGHATVVILLFLASFFPVGAFLLPTDHWLHWIGWADLGLLVAAVLMWATRRAGASDDADAGDRQAGADSR